MCNCNVLQLQPPVTGQMTSYSTFSIASLIGQQQLSDEDTTSLSRISNIETTVEDHPASGSERVDDCLDSTRCQTTTTASLHEDDDHSTDDEASGLWLTHARGFITVTLNRWTRCEVVIYSCN